MNKIPDIGRLWPGWQIEGLLGTGLFGTVYLARSQVYGRTVFAAVKVITVPPRNDAAENAEKQGVSRELLQTYFSKFKNDLSWELTMFRSIRAPGVIPVDELAVQDNEPFGWTGYLRTGVYTPMQVYFDKTPPSPEDAIRLGLELSSALGACEEYGMVHGEVKPKNVFVTDEGTFMLADFGIRRCLEKAGIFGTSSDDFDAPEIRAGERKYSAATDIYSIGMLMMWAAYGGSLPVEKERGKLTELERDFAAIIKKATAKSPEDRYNSVAELRYDLLKVPCGKRAVRRAMAMAAAIDAVKRNGGVIRAFQQEKADEEKKESKLKSFIKLFKKEKD